MDGRQGRLLWNLGFVSVDGMELESGFAMIAFAGYKVDFIVAVIYILTVWWTERFAEHQLSLYVGGVYLPQRS
jgi:hypothetical protein